MKKSIFLIGMLLPILSYSQNIDSATQKKSIPTTPRLGDITIGNLVVPVKANENAFTMQLPFVDISIPIYKKFLSAHPVLIKTGIRYQGLLLSNEKNIGSTNFHSITVPIIFSYSISRAANISFIGLTTVSSDFKRSLEGKDILYTVGVRIGFQRNKAFRYGVTLAYTDNYAGSYLIPIPDIDWSISKKLNLTGVIPSRVSLKYKISGAQSLGITAGISSNMYRLQENQQAQYLHLQQTSGGLIYDLQFGKRWKLNMIAGHTFTQRLETFNIDQKVSLNRFDKINDRIPNVSYRNNSFIFQGGISYQF